MKTLRCLLVSSALFTATQALSPTPAEAQGGKRVVANPPALQKKIVAPTPPSGRGAGRLTMNQQPIGPLGETELDLNVVYTQGKLWNPGANRYDNVRLRSYQGSGVDVNNPFISPTVEVNPGETVRITLHNKLPADPTCAHGAMGDENEPHCFNGTNLHAHGLWVNPGGNGDNVLLTINPGVSFQYEYKIPPDHEAGTFWYHTHRHGSTALQVSSGMAGALIVRGDRIPTATTRGDIDVLLRPSADQSFRERIVVMQQIQYACRDANDAIKRNADKSYACDQADLGTIEGYDQFGPSEWPTSGRYTSINGQVLPTFVGGRVGQIERWRVIHGGVRQTISLQFRQLKASAPAVGRLNSSENDAYVAANCTGEPLAQHLIAADGLTMAAAMKTNVTVFQPAYRWDILMAFPAAGTYCVLDASAPTSVMGSTPVSRQLLGFVEVAPGTSMGSNVTDYIRSQLVKSAEAQIPIGQRARVVADLNNGLKFGAFVGQPDIDAAEVTGQQELTFNIDFSNPTPQFQVDGRPYDANRIDRTLVLGSVDEWTLKSAFVSHPFHIHINPFQIVKILDPTGKDVSAPDAEDTFGTTAATPDPQFRGLRGVWKDVLWLKNVGGTTPGQYTIVVRTRYRRYIGDFVLHCHILDHEDQGMMQRIRIVLPDK